jgi:hypothetical protein
LDWAPQWSERGPDMLLDPPAELAPMRHHERTLRFRQERALDRGCGHEEVFAAIARGRAAMPTIFKNPAMARGQTVQR